MPAGTARDHDLEVGFLSYRARIARALFKAAEAASRRGGPFSGGVFVHAAALYAGLALRPAEITADAWQ